jgi:hypothetical protein
VGFFRTANKVQEQKTYINDNGYYCFTNSDYPVHGWVAKKKLGRKLRKGEVVHPINHNNRDNSEENLFVCSSQDEQEKIHWVDKLFGKGKGVEIINGRTYVAIEIIPKIIKVMILYLVVYLLLEILGIV